MEKVVSAAGATIAFERTGSGPALVLVHGSLEDHESNWVAVTPILEASYTVYAMDRRGRGESSATEGHSIEDEFADVAAVITAVGEPAFVLGHSYGAHCALGGAALVPGSVRKLVLYEPPWPAAMPAETMAALEKDAGKGDWESLTDRFMREVLRVPDAELNEFKQTDLWQTYVNDAKPSMGDWRALVNYKFDAKQFGSLDVPTLLLTGTESPNPIYVTDVLAAELPNAAVVRLDGQGHEANVTDPQQFAAKVTRFLLG